MTIGPPKPGRIETDRVRIPPVETMPCGTGTHRLTSVVEGRRGYERLVTYCIGCERSWSDLDTEVRASLPAAKPHHKKGRRP